MNNISNKPQESKADAFKRIAEKRVDKILKSIDLLSNCSNPYSYHYTDEDIKKIFKEINSRIKSAKLKFESNLERKGFKL